MKELSSTTFGEFSRYKVTLCLDRFGNPCCFVEDAEQTDELVGLPKVIAQLS